MLRVDTRSERKKAKDAKFQSEPIGLIEKPLKHIRERDGQWVEDHKEGKHIIKGKPHSWVHGKLYAIARLAAKHGKGALVQKNCSIF